MKTATKIRLPFLLLLALSLASCSSNYKRVAFDASEKQSYLEQLNHFRERKDLFFHSSLSSPLTQAQRTVFRQLDYYPPNFNLIFMVKLLKESSPERIGIQATGGETRAAVKYGRFDFDVAGKRLSLYVYKMDGDDSNELFVPFTDETCGKDSYSGGRYIDLNQNESGEYLLDFNYAYNPYCAYNHNYSCPIVPQENHLDARIEAGEMKY